MAGAHLSVKDAEDKRQNEENSGQPAGKFHQHIGGLSAENILSHTATEGSTEALAFGPLHQDDQRHQQRNQHVDSENNVDQNVHFREREYVERRLGRKPLILGTTFACLRRLASPARAKVATGWTVVG